jgi:NAD(P)-dependent dehydrogenase (short-subunit alcohol dehydrogenase family)
MTIGRLKDKVAIITGTGSGMGRAAALAFAREGANVVGCDWNEAAAEETLTLVRKSGYEMASLHPLDVGAEGSATKLVQFTVERFGGVDILYNNAAANTAIGPFSTTKLEDFKYTIHYEITIIFMAAQAVWSAMINRGGGVIINTGSGAAYRDFLPLRLTAHGAGKAGVLGLTRMLATEGGRHKIRALSLSPGVIDTPRFASYTSGSDKRRAVRDQLRAKIPLGRFGDCDEVAKVACFLASSDASYITGTDILVDGGMVGSSYIPLEQDDRDGFPYSTSRDGNPSR